MHAMISPRAHGLLDAIVVAVFALAPSLLGLAGRAATLCYVLAGVHLAMTLLTDFPAGAARVIPFPLHGTVELIVGIVLPVLGLLLFEDTARWFFVAMGVVILATWALTTYRADVSAR